MTRFFRRVLPFCFRSDIDDEAAAVSDCCGSDADEGFDVELLLLLRFRLRDSLDLIPPPLLLLPALLGLAAEVRDALPDDDGRVAPAPGAAAAALPSSAILAERF